MRVLASLGLEHAASRGDGFCSSPAQVFRWYQSLGLEMKEVYGMTENFGYPAHATASHQRLDCR